MAIRTYGPNAVDWEQRVDLARLRDDRLSRLRSVLEGSHLGSLLTFDFPNIRYMTATHIGTWAIDKLIRFALLPRGGEPVIWDFGSAARHHQIYNPWLDGEKRARAGISTLRGAFHPDAGIAEEVEIGRASCREGVLQYVVEWRGVVKKLGKLDEVLRRETCD